MQLKTDKAQFAVEFIDLPKASAVDDAVWEPFQIHFLNNTNRLGIDLKSRQIAWSFTAAVDAVADGAINPGNPYIFVSINQDESREKIRYVKSIINATDPPIIESFGLQIIRASLTEIEVKNGTRFLSHPQRPPRGKPKARVYLDEKAHYADGMDREIYMGALPATTKGDGYIRIGSSPAGAKGLFWEIFTQSMRQYPGFVRGTYPWWIIKAFCKDVKTASKVAPMMETEERVYQFGRRPVIEIFENMFLEDFQQEYECAWIDESTAWITWDTIKQNQQEGLLHWHAKSPAEALAMVDEIIQAQRDGKIERVLAGGIDIGRTRDLTEFMLVGRGESGRLPIRFMISLARTRLDDQEACFQEIIRRMRTISLILVDQNGLGRDLAERLAVTGKAQGVDFTNETKELWAINARLQAERMNTPLPMNRDLAYQIHSIKKTVTATKLNRYDAGRNEKHHADMFWSWALALDAGKAGGISADQWEELHEPVKEAGGRWK